MASVVRQGQGQGQGQQRRSLRSGRRNKAEVLATADKHAGALVARFMASRRIKRDILDGDDGDDEAALVLPEPDTSVVRDAREEVAAVVLTRLYIDGLQDQERRERERFVKEVTSCAEPPTPLVSLPNMEQTAYMLETWDADEDVADGLVQDAAAARNGNDEAAAIAAAILLNQARAGSAVPSESDSVLLLPGSPPSSSRSGSVSSMVSMASMTSTGSTASTVSELSRVQIDRLVHQATAASVADSVLPRPSPPPKTAYDAWARDMAARSWTQGYFSSAASTPSQSSAATHTVQHGMPSPPQSPTELGSWSGQAAAGRPSAQRPSEMQQQMKLMQQQMQLEQRQRHKHLQQLQHLQCQRQLPLPPVLRTSKPPAGLPTPPPSFTASMQQQQQHLRLPPPHALPDAIATTIVTLPPVATTSAAAAAAARRDLLTPVSPGSSPRGSPRVAAAAAAAAEKRDRHQRRQRQRQQSVSGSGSRPSAPVSAFSSFSTSFSSTTSTSSSSSSSSSTTTTSSSSPHKRPPTTTISRPHCNVKYETAELDFILYQRTTKNRAWDDVTAAFNAALPRLRPYADRERGDREARGEAPTGQGSGLGSGPASGSAAARPRPERTTPGLQASYYRQRLALPLLDAAGRLVFDDASGKQLFTEVMVRDDKSRKKSLRRVAAAGNTTTTTAAKTTTTAPEDTRVHLVLYFPERVSYYDYWFVSEEDKALARQRAYERNLQRTQRGLQPWHPGCDDPETGILIRGKDAA